MPNCALEKCIISISLVYRRCMRLESCTVVPMSRCRVVPTSLIVSLESVSRYTVTRDCRRTCWRVGSTYSIMGKRGFEADSEYGDASCKGRGLDAHRPCRFAVRFRVLPVLSRTLNCSHCRCVPLPSLPARTYVASLPAHVCTHVLTACVLCCLAAVPPQPSPSPLPPSPSPVLPPPAAKGPVR